MILFLVSLVVLYYFLQEIIWCSFKIKKGNHRPLPPIIKLYTNTCFKWKVKFSTNCRYSLPSADSADINKLCGIGFFPNHHTESARFGWRYNPLTDKIDLVTYCYVNKVRLHEIFLASVDFNKEITIGLEIKDDYYNFTVSGMWPPVAVYKTIDPILGYRLGVYFGGNNVAPNEMLVELKRVNKNILIMDSINKK